MGLGCGGMTVRVGVLVGDGLAVGPAGGIFDGRGVASASGVFAGEGVALGVAVAGNTSAGEDVTVTTAVASVDAGGGVGVVLGAAVGRVACGGNGVAVTAATASVDAGGGLEGSGSGVEGPQPASSRAPSMVKTDRRNSLAWRFVMLPSFDLRQSVLASASAPPHRGRTPQPLPVQRPTVVDRQDPRIPLFR